jgi:amino acid transporter
MLKRDIGKWGIVLLMLNNVVGAGIYGLPSKLFDLTNMYSLVILACCALIVFVFVFIFAEVASQFNRSGGAYLYVYEAYGKLPGFIIGWLMLIGRVAGFAALINLIVDYFSYISPYFMEPSIRILTIILLSILLFLVNVFSVKSSATFSNILGISKIIPLLIFICIGLFYMDVNNFTINTAVPDFTSISSALFVALFAFTSWETALINTGEMKNPVKNIPSAMIITVAFAAIFYILIQFTVIGTFPDLAFSTKPIADAAGIFMGPIGGIFIIIGATISILGTLNANLLAGSRLPFALSEEGQFPKLFSRTHHSTGVPLISLVIYTSISVLVSLSGSFIYALSINVLSKISCYILVSMALITFRRKNSSIPYKLKFGKLLAILGIILGLFLLYASEYSDFKDFLIFISIGLVLYFIFRLKSK